eukprot:scaffold928_cov370-Prasinococcus_capsulatus_cf.AAC.3
MEVAWNKLNTQGLLCSEEERERLQQEVDLLRNLKHKNIIKLYHSWVDKTRGEVNFITEIFTSGTLREYAPWRGGARPKLRAARNDAKDRVDVVWLDQVSQETSARGPQGSAQLVKADPQGPSVPAQPRSANHPPRPEVRQHLHQRQRRRGEDRRPGLGDRDARAEASQCDRHPGVHGP